MTTAAPQERVRDYLDANGPRVVVPLDNLLTTWAVKTGSADELQDIVADLASVGVTVDKPLAHLLPKDPVELTAQYDAPPTGPAEGPGRGRGRRMAGMVALALALVGVGVAAWLGLRAGEDCDPAAAGPHRMLGDCGQGAPIAAPALGGRDLRLSVPTHDRPPREEDVPRKPSSSQLQTLRGSGTTAQAPDVPAPSRTAGAGLPVRLAGGLAMPVKPPGRLGYRARDRRPSCGRRRSAAGSTTWATAASSTGTASGTTVTS